ncbi:MAG TPA: 2-amino-4-hydroxy-6-hydroxymethyldihydropteridine diphosphokinase [Longimicrobium sp.]|nr:2-amino-4-hydroxy-6-hydroxymethyldihydropteridine diphosphokinase [Longimicrobium sp.]
MIEGPPGVEVLLGLGGNVGDPARQIAAAIDELGAVVTVTALSSVYRTEPVGFAGQPDFLNLVLVGRTTLEPEALLDATQEVERAMGRVRTFRNAPRPIDIDVLAYGERIIRTARLTVPHPALPERAFVLVPLAEAAPGWRHPGLGSTARELLAAGMAGRVERVGALSLFR